MTATQLRTMYGPPSRILNANYWIYESIPQAHRGLLDVYFAPGSSESSRRVTSVLFTDGGEGAPSDMPNLLGLSREALVAKFGEPVREGTPDAQGTLLEFRNGVIVRMSGDKTYEYGVYTLP